MAFQRNFTDSDPVALAAVQPVLVHEPVEDLPDRGAAASVQLGALLFPQLLARLQTAGDNIFQHELIYELVG